MSPPSDSELRFGVLGPTAVWRDGREVDLGSPQQRAVAALLLLHRNEVISTDRMLDALWPTGPPPNAVQVVRTYVSRLRSGPLGAAHAATLVTHRSGYELRTRPDQVDADRFESLVTAGRSRLDGGDAPAAEALLREALGLGRGVPLAELADDHRAGYERDLLLELFDVAREELIEAQLAQGRHRELLPGLRAAVRSRPLRERSWGQLMAALYRSGRQAEALDVYHQARRALDAVGLLPGPRLRALERMILVQDAELELPSNPARWLPRYETSFVGRDRERAALEAHLRDGRLVTLVGPAGVGKTRLAAEVIAGRDPPRAARRWWVDLGSVPPGRVVAAVARTLNVQEVPGRTRVDLVLASLRESPGLLVLDNCEHVLEEVARLAARILAGDCEARVLCTSRVALGLAGELFCPLAGLGVPPSEPMAAERLLDFPASRLLIERARGAIAIPRMDADETAAVAEVVDRLDGLPLAIELAGGALQSLSVVTLARGLWERLSLSSDLRQAVPQRQRSLEAAIAWSYELLSGADQAVLRRLSVFPGSFDAAAADAVAAPTRPEDWDVVPAVARLVDASLLESERRDATTRYRLLQTVRTFARERLREAGEQELAARRHREVYTALAKNVADNMIGSGLSVWLATGRQEHENFHAALRWSLDRGDAEPALCLAAHLASYWFRAGFLIQGRELLERALRIADPGSPWRPRALVGRALLAHVAPDALASSDEAVAAYEHVGDPELLAILLEFRAHALLVPGRLEEARADVVRARDLAASVGSGEGLAFADHIAGCIALRAGELDEAERLLMRARTRFRRIRGTLDAGYTLLDLARVTLAQQRPAATIEHATTALADFRGRQDPRGVAAALLLLGQAHARRDDSHRACSLLHEAAALAERWGFSATAQEAKAALAALSAPLART
jgi:predicted ATPase/DNA-binding SARP family transcriptional activator